MLQSLIVRASKTQEGKYDAISKSRAKNAIDKYFSTKNILPSAIKVVEGLHEEISEKNSEIESLTEQLKEMGIKNTEQQEMIKRMDNELEKMTISVYETKNQKNSEIKEQDNQQELNRSMIDDLKNEVTKLHKLNEKLTQQLSNEKK